ncbi:gamma-aminobutyric acid type B receptor subunit 2 [Trichonephila inaurata madagascariensis]|uniref:Gamma-aminobutyric acid type B receptor subunit 2 n=1 Tax=Trichonephila inaurata madagascariensis TaxID=2747483 RepID=A0A8X6WZX7_9ARAC|nr:gamma-aminobutyric acid type B receptor subunit 2 [Trichonephila inaurata madagascariensis]
MYGRKYQWIIVGMYRERWWEVRDHNSSCSPWELSLAMEGHISTDVLPLSSSENITVSGLFVWHSCEEAVVHNVGPPGLSKDFVTTYNKKKRIHKEQNITTIGLLYHFHSKLIKRLTAAEYASQYDKRREREYSRFHGYAYDGIWAIALAIQSVAQKLKAKGRHLKEFQYRDPFWGQLFRDAFNETSFTGVTGPVNFIKNERRSQILLKQFQNGSEVKIGEYDPVFDELDFSKGVPIIWSKF